MKQFHPFYSIGTFGIITVALIHITLALGFALSQGHSTFYVLYTMFATFLILGVAFTVKELKNPDKPTE